MPEYLAPGVYVEEVDSDRPIEGVSTSTAGMVGVTMRGPIGLPQLVTSVPDFAFQFGGRLNYRDFTNDTSYLPLAIEGFFNNGGKRVYVVRVAPDTATYATARLFDRGDQAVSWTTTLASVAAKGDTLILVLTPSAPPGPNDWFLIDDPGAAEYLKAQVAYPLALESSLVNSVSATDLITGYTFAPDSPTTALDPAGAKAGSTKFTVASVANIAVGQLIAVGIAPHEDLVKVVSAPATALVTVAAPLAYDHLGGALVTPKNLSLPATGSQACATAAAPGDRLLMIAGGPGTLPGAGGAVSIGAGPTEEWHLVGDGELLAVRGGLAFSHVAGAPVVKPTLTAIAPQNRAITDDVAAGAVELPLAEVSGIVAGTVLKLGSAAGPNEYVVVETAPGGSGGGSVSLTYPVRWAYGKGSPGALASPFADTTAAPPATITLLERAAHTDEQALFVADRGVFGATDTVKIGQGLVEYQVLTTSTHIQPIVPTTPVQSSHNAGLAVAGRTVIGSIRAIDRGGWGNCLEVVFDDDDPLLDTAPTESKGPGVPDLKLQSTTGMEAGTILEFYTGTGVNKTVVLVQKISGKTGKTVHFDPPGLRASVNPTMRVRTREFKMTAQCVQADPRTLQEQVVLGMSETVRHLSMDDRHSRYFVKAIGSIGGKDQLTDGESALVRVSDSQQAQSEALLRLGPDTRLQNLAGGDDAIGDVNDDTYIGQDSLDPSSRTGIQALKNLDEISLVAAPGRTSEGIQNELINQCNLLRYRFAVIDSINGDTVAPGQAVAHVMQQRDLYDTKYAALYFPWLEIADPFPANPRVVGTMSVPPSGHVLGIYARVDNDRGVHKAPANEVVNVIDDLQYHLVKEQQDILNPRNINVIRDFRSHERGIRVWGARCITSDEEWKYVNVRRLFIFLEHSLDRGTQWVVFEPNNERTWAFVKQSVSSFLTDVWRDGALMGKTADEAFFVKCDRTTMTDSDLQNGRLILVVGVAPVFPAEFVIIRIGQWTAGSKQGV